MGIRPLFTVFTLLLCAIAVGADKWTVIKDSEAIRYVGKEVEVHGRVVSVTMSPVGTAFINFGGEYPNQKSAGYIAAGSKVMSRKRLTMLPGKTFSIAGTIELCEGKPEINIIRADQIKVLDSQTERRGPACRCLHSLVVTTLFTGHRAVTSIDALWREFPPAARRFALRSAQS
jgi:hypothetical protein